MSTHSRFWREGYLAAIQGTPVPHYGWREWRKAIAVALGYAAGQEAQHQGNVITTTLINL